MPEAVAYCRFPMPDRSASLAPFSLRLSRDERARLEREAAGQPLGAYIRSRLLNDGNIAPRQRGKFPVKDHQALAALLGRLGQSEIAVRLSVLADAARSGSLVLLPNLEADLRQAIAEVGEMRALLLRALGLSEDQS